MVMTSACACAAFGLLAISVATDYWLYTSDLQPNKNNGTKGVYKNHWSGLWRQCTVTGNLFSLYYNSQILYLTRFKITAP